MGVNSVKMPTEMWNVISGKPESIHALNRGDSFAVQDNWYTVTDVLYYKKGPSYITEYVIVDNNGLQIDGNIADVCSPYPIDKKFEAFNFHVINIDGHDFDQIAAAFKEARETKGQPTAIIAKTVKGKGVSYMENQVNWHGAAPNEELYNTAVEELTAKLNELEAAK